MRLGSRASIGRTGRSAQFHGRLRAGPARMPHASLHRDRGSARSRSLRRCRCRDRVTNPRAPAAKPSSAPDARVVPFIADDYTKAVAEARARKVPLFIEAWAPW